MAYLLDKCTGRVKLASIPAGIFPLMLVAKNPPAMLPASGSTPQSLLGTVCLLRVTIEG